MTALILDRIWYSDRTAAQALSVSDRPLGEGEAAAAGPATTAAGAATTEETL